MVNTHKKGMKKELMCQHDLAGEGYKTVFRSYTIKMGPIFKGIDFADLFDVVAIRYSHWRFISVKHHGSFNPHMDLIRKFGAEHGFPGMAFELWMWHKPKWTGRGKGKIWSEAHWEKVVLFQR